MIDQWKIIEKYGRFFFNGGTPTKMDSSKIAGSYLSMDDNSGVTPNQTWETSSNDSWKHVILLESPTKLSQSLTFGHPIAIAI